MQGGREQDANVYRQEAGPENPRAFPDAEMSTQRTWKSIEFLYSVNFSEQICSLTFHISVSLSALLPWKLESRGMLCVVKRC